MTSSKKHPRGFASDNYAGVHPEVLAALEQVNTGHQVAYGDDEVTEKLRGTIRKHFGDNATVYPVFNGTGANVVALQSMCKPWEAVICAELAHVDADEGGAPEKVAGLKLWTVPTPDAKLTPSLLDRQAHGFGFVHRAQPAVVTITQSSELGTVYSIQELTALIEHAHELGLLVHMDGARVSNAAASLGVPLRAFTTDVGVDVLSLGGTKNGTMAAEAVVVIDRERTPEVDSAVPFVRKTLMQLPSKMRFVSAQLLALYEGDLWLRNANHANAMAQVLAGELRAISGVQLTQPVNANAVFAVLPEIVTQRLQEDWSFYTWDHVTGEVRLMCSWNTTAEDISAFIADVSRNMASVTNQ